MEKGIEVKKRDEWKLTSMTRKVVEVIGIILKGFIAIFAYEDPVERARQEERTKYYYGSYFGQ